MCSLRCPSPHSSSGDLIDLSDDASVRSAAGISSCHSITSSDVKSKVSPFDRMFLEVEDRMHKLFERYAQINAQKASRTLKVPTKHEQLDIFQSTSSSETGGAIWLSRISSFVEHDIPNAEDVDGRTQRSYDTISSYSNFPSVQPIANSSRLSKTLTMKADNLAGKTSVGDSAESENDYGDQRPVLPLLETNPVCGKPDMRNDITSCREEPLLLHNAACEILSYKFMDEPFKCGSSACSTELPKPGLKNHGRGSFGADDVENSKLDRFFIGSDDLRHGNMADTSLQVSNQRKTDRTVFGNDTALVREVENIRGSTLEPVFVDQFSAVSLQCALQCRKSTFLRRSRERQEQIRKNILERCSRKTKTADYYDTQDEVKTVDEVVTEYCKTAKMSPRSRHYPSKDWPEHCKPLWARKNVISLKTAKEETERRLNALQPTVKSSINAQEELHSRRLRLQAYARVVRNRNHYLYSRKRCDCGRTLPFSR